MVKTLLIFCLGIFFIANAFNHFFNKHTLVEYAEKRNLLAPKLMVHLSGLLLLFGGLTLITKWMFYYGIAGLCIFLVIATFSIHRFWLERSRDMKMLEFTHFLKNIAIIIELLYIAETFEP
ncbi:MAG: DoxX family membrane protein [Saprospirales bacterium]|nr:MAG: DoxX family membrane protein [Saprospirales bacterium]